MRHARQSTRVVVRAADEGTQIRLTVHDDGAAGTTGSTPGYGLLGITERATLLGGNLHAGPAPDGGWTVDAALPKRGATR